MQESEITYLPITLYIRITWYDYHHTIYIHIDYDIDTSYTYLKKNEVPQHTKYHISIYYHFFLSTHIYIYILYHVFKKHTKFVIVYLNLCKNIFNFSLKPPPLTFLIPSRSIAILYNAHTKMSNNFSFTTIY